MDSRLHLCHRFTPKLGKYNCVENDGNEVALLNFLLLRTDISMYL